MPRTPLFYTHEFPYHIMARSNNKEWFYVDQYTCWNIFADALEKVSTELGFQVHAFVLMDNHYHLIGTCCYEKNLGVVMHLLQKTVSRKINAHTGRINHVFGGAYKASLIKNPHQYANVYKYVARNPIQADLSEKVDQYFYSTFSRIQYLDLKKIRIHAVKKEMQEYLVDFLSKDPDWLDKSFNQNTYYSIQAGLRKPVFSPKDRMTRKVAKLL